MGVGNVQLLDHAAHGEGRPNGPLWIVLVRGRHTEDRHHRVADELLDGAAEAFERGAHVPVERCQQAADVLGIEQLGAAR